MEAMVIMLMEKDATTGFLSKEVGSFTVEQHGELIEGIFMLEKEGKKMVHLRLTTHRDVEDWEFSALYDFYEPEVFGEQIADFIELEDHFNPTWEIIFEFFHNQDKMEDMLNFLLKKHHEELERIYPIIEDKKDDYQ